MLKLTRSVFTVAMTDVYGDTHGEAKCYIANCLLTESAEVCAASGEVEIEAICRYTVRYWPDETTMNSGVRSMDYVSPDGAGQFEVDVELGMGFGVVDAARQHFMKTFGR